MIKYRKNSHVLLSGFFFLAVCLVFQFATLAEAQISRQDGSAPFAVVELYTSEGCSSCPPADRVLKNLTQKARSKNLRIFTVGYHVDYWDYLGWKDRFSKAKYSNRQRFYAQRQNAKSVYTPQMVINGEHVFVGHRQDYAQRIIDEALTKKAQITLNFSKAKFGRDQLKFSFKLDRVIEGDLLSLVLVERQLSNKILKGENAGKTLSHDNVVQALQMIELTSTEGDMRMDVPKGGKRENMSLIGYVQDPKTLTVKGANILDLEKL